MNILATRLCRALTRRVPISQIVCVRSLSAGSLNRSERDAWNDSDARETEWRRWNSLDIQDERERLSFSLFLGQLQQRFDEHDESELGAESDTDAPIFIDRPHRSSITFPEEIKMDCVEKLLKDLVTGKQLSLQCIQNIVDHAMPILKSSPNVVRLPKPVGKQRVFVVGDLHGSLADLHHIFEQNGWPSEDNIYIFNGDFVDRGIFGLEVLMVLLACKVSLPGSVLLNRGNHEDRLLCTAYGFHSEVLQKANKRVFGSLCQIFSFLPLVTVIEQTALVVHGGLPAVGSPETLLQDVDSISRDAWETMQRVELSSLSQENRQQLRMMKDLLWSDPDATVQGVAPSPRGAGCLFGNDVVFKYLSALQLPHLVRSHQCVLKGFETTMLPESFEHHTVFSASNYCGSQNLAAVLIFTANKDAEVGRSFVSWVPPMLSNTKIAEKSLRVIDDTIRKIKMALESSYASSGADVHLNSIQCNELVEKALGVPMPWSDIVEISTNGEASELPTVNFPAFLDNYEEYVRSRGQLSFEGAHMYKKLKLLQAVFAYFDMDNDGRISRKEWLHGCDLLNSELDENDMKVDGSRFFEILDMDKSGFVSLNELCEGFRISRLRRSSPVQGD